MFDDVIEALNVELDRLRLTPAVGLTTRVRVACTAGFGCDVMPEVESQRAPVWTCRWSMPTASERIQMPAEVSEALAKELQRIQSAHASRAGEPLDGIIYGFDITEALVDLGVWL